MKSHSKHVQDDLENLFRSDVKLEGEVQCRTRSNSKANRIKFAKNISSQTKSKSPVRNILQKSLLRSNSPAHFCLPIIIRRNREEEEIRESLNGPRYLMCELISNQPLNFNRTMKFQWRLNIFAKQKKRETWILLIAENKTIKETLRLRYFSQFGFKFESVKLICLITEWVFTSFCLLL